jgi:uncharacterized protein (DUF1697 family)
VRTHVALLRGINVGGKNKLRMADLKELASSLGLDDVTTYVQSGNLAFTTGSADGLAERLSASIRDALGLDVPVFVVTAETLRDVLRDNPYADEPSPKAVHAVFLPAKPDAGYAESVAAAVARAAEKGDDGAATVVGDVLFVHTPSGFGRSELVVQLGRGGKAAPLTGTTGRNIATVRALVDLCE